MTPIEIKSFLSEVYEQVKHLHHITTSYAQHKALGKFYEEWDGLSDDFIETYQGRYSRIEGEYSVKVASNISAGLYLESVSGFLHRDLVAFVPAGDIDLANIVADMIGLTNKTLYLLSLK